MTDRRKDKMSLVAFMQAGSTSVYAGSWRHPATEHGYLDASYYAKIGRQLEEGCFDMMFFDDRLAMPGIYGGSVLYADFAGNLDSCIGIRTMLMQGKHAYLQAGAGIVADSDPAREFEESINKAQALLRAVEMARGSGQ